VLLPLFCKQLLFHLGHYIQVSIPDVLKDIYVPFCVMNNDLPDELSQCECNIKYYERTLQETQVDARINGFGRIEVKWRSEKVGYGDGKNSFIQILQKFWLTVGSMEQIINFIFSKMGFVKQARKKNAQNTSNNCWKIFEILSLQYKEGIGELVSLCSPEKELKSKHFFISIAGNDEMIDYIYNKSFK